MKVRGLPEPQGLYTPENEHDSCGVGFLANIKNRKSHNIIRQGLQILVNLDHRGRSESQIQPNPGFRQCPKCGQASLIRQEGCDVCTSCGYSKCG